jgi:DNA-directed RNA polymerase specialized sigma24 family protein
MGSGMRSPSIPREAAETIAAVAARRYGHEAPGLAFARAFGAVAVACRRAGASDADAQDAAATVALRAVEAQRPGREVRDPGAWTARVASHALIDDHRRARRDLDLVHSLSLECRAGASR